MQPATIGDEQYMARSVVTSRIALTRLTVALFQGAVLYFLYHAAQAHVWPATGAHVFAPVLLVVLFVPVLVVSGLGHLGARRIWIWALVAAIFVAVLGFYDIWRAGYNEGISYEPPRAVSSITPSPLVMFFTAIGFYIAHALVLAAAIDGWRMAAYPSYFETAWKLGIQLMFSGLFVSVLWLILWMGASLFMLVKLDFLKALLQKAWFFIPVTAFAFSTALHITDVRPGLVRGIRTLLLVLMSWLLPITVLLIAGFLFTLPFTGLGPLWATRHATAVLLGAAAALVVLINAAFQDGESDTQVARVLRTSAKVACILLLPMTLIAVYSLGLRVQQYGWTTDRIIAAACLLVAFCYAGGYSWAAISRGKWLSRIAPTNIVTAFVVIAMLLALFTPIADPARLSVANQIARLEAGRVSVDKFDFSYLKFQGARYGKEALQSMKRQVNGPDAAVIRARAEAALQNENPWDAKRGRDPIANASDVAANIIVWPQSAALPPSFLSQAWAEVKRRHVLPQCLAYRDKKCDAFLIDFDSNGKPEVLLKNVEQYGRMTVFAEDATGKWKISGTIDSPSKSCKNLWQALADGTYRVVPPLHNDLEVDGLRLHVNPFPAHDVPCNGAGK